MRIDPSRASAAGKRGRVTSAGPGGVFLGYVHKELIVPGSTVALEDGRTATVLGLPFGSFPERGSANEDLGRDPRSDVQLQGQRGGSGPPHPLAAARDTGGRPSLEGEAGRAADRPGLAGAERVAAIAAIKANPETKATVVIGYVGHERTDIIDAAKAAGCDQVLAKGEFARRLPELLAES